MVDAIQGAGLEASQVRLVSSPYIILLTKSADGKYSYLTAGNKRACEMQMASWTQISRSHI